MVWRCQFGERNGVYGAWVSKPGIDVTAAVPGQFLLDTSSQVFQQVLNGDTVVVTKPGIGSFSTTVPLPAGFNYSRMVVWAYGYGINLTLGTVYVDGNYNGNLDYKFRTGGGSLTLTVTSAANFAISAQTIEVHMAWVIFRATF